MGSSKLYSEPATTGSQSTRFSSQAIRKELDRILSSTKLARARQIHRFLRFVVEKTLAGRQDQIKQYTLQINPDHPLTLAMLADWYKLEYVRMRAEKDTLEMAEYLAQHAVLLDPQCQQARFIMATISF